MDYPRRPDRLLVRAADTDALYAVHEIVGHGRAHRTLDQARERCAELEAKSEEDKGSHIFVVELKDGVVIGDIAVRFDRPEEKQAENGYSLHPDHWGRGYATEALSALLEYLFAERRLHRVVAITASDNSRSAALLGRLGFRREAYYREGLFDYQRQKWIDSIGYALLSIEWADQSDRPGPECPLSADIQSFRRSNVTDGVNPSLS